jgi:hypothetical protein
MNTPSLACPDIGAWRAWLDHEDESPLLDEHLADCPACQRMVADLREDAASVHEAFALLAPIGLPSAAETAVARERLRLPLGLTSGLSAAEAGHRSHRGQASPISLHLQEPIPMFIRRISNPWRVAVGGLAAAVALSLLVAFTPEGSAAAASFLAQFRSQQVAAVEISPQTQADIVKTLNALGNLGTVKTPGGIVDASRAEAAARAAGEQVKSASLAEAGQSVGFTLLTPDPATLPAGLDTAPQIHVMAASQIRFTFDKTKASAYFKSTGHPEVSLPDKFDGATLVVSIPSAAILQYGDKSSRDALIVGEAGELVVDVEGGKVSLPEMRDFLLGLPGLPQATVSQLKQIQNWNETLPIPIPVDKVNWQSTTFKGNQGLLLNDNSGVGSAAIWHANGHLYGVAGSLKATDLKRIADGLR